MKKNKIKDFVIVISFLAVLIGGFVLNICMPDQDVSATERRKLKQLPQTSVEQWLSGKFMKEFEAYALDQFVFRDSFRMVKASTSQTVFRKLDNNGLIYEDGIIYKQEYPLKEEQIMLGAQKIQDIYETYLTGMNCYYSIIPDKNYFRRENAPMLSLDYGRLVEIMNENLRNMKYIDLFSILNESDYYKTDIHWRQERLFSVVKQLSYGMDFKQKATLADYTQVEKKDFKGVYYGQLALPIDTETLIYLVNQSTEETVVYHYEREENREVYTVEEYESTDPYNLFLDGPAALLVLNNPNADTDKELLLFRDSFGSSLAPLLLENYKKITMIDLRYIHLDLLFEYITFKEQDVLFLYSSVILNNSSLFK